jgi:thiol-disulfide isomerase/thioredoxin
VIRGIVRRSRVALAAWIALAASVALAACAGAPTRARPRADLSRLATATLAGEHVAIAGPGPARLVEVWATWCEPCVRAAAAARPVLARHPRVVAYAVVVDGDRLAHGASGAVGEVLVVQGGAAAAARAGFDRFPAFVALDRRGHVVGELTGATPHLASSLERMLRNAEGSVGERD